VALSWSGLANPGGYDNVLMPALAMLAIVSSLALDGILRSSKSAITYAALCALFALQFTLLYYPIADQIPTSVDLAAGNLLVKRLRAATGSVFVPYHPELALMAGKPGFANYIALYELEGGQGGGDELLWKKVRSELQTSFSRHKFELIMLDKTQFWGSPGRYYRSTPIEFDDGAFLPVTGWKIRPVVAYSAPP